MGHSQPTGTPSVLRCPHCGAPVEAAPFAVTTRCAYCGHTIQLAQQHVQQPAPARALQPAANKASRAGVVIVLGVVAASAALLVAFLTRPNEPTLASTNPLQAALPAGTPARPAAPTPPSPAQAPAPTTASYPLRALLGVNVSVDIDASRAHLLALFPTITSEPRADQLSYTLPLSHPWFSAAELNWKNEKAGKLVSVALRPPVADQNFKNQKEIADCLTKGLNQPQVRELNHLAGELSYFWGPHFPKAWADLYSGYLWLAFEDPKGVAPVTFANVVRTLDGCAAHAP